MPDKGDATSPYSKADDDVRRSFMRRMEEAHERIDQKLADSPLFDDCETELREALEALEALMAKIAPKKWAATARKVAA